MKRLKSWLLEQILTLDEWITIKLEERKFKEPKRGSIWVSNYATPPPEGWTPENLDPFKAHTVTRVSMSWVWLTKLMVDDETGLLKKHTFKTFKDDLIPKEDGDPVMYRRIYEPCEPERSVWPKLLRRHLWCL